MLKFVLLLAFSAACCVGQRRWAGSYSRTSAEDALFLDNGNYQTSTEDSFKYDHSAKWPSDNWKGRDAYDTTTASYTPPSRRNEYDPRMDVRPDRRIEKGVSPAMPGDKRQQDHSVLEDEYYRRGLNRPSIADEKGYYPQNTRRGEDPRENRQYDVPKVEEHYNTRRIVENSKGDAGDAFEESSRGQKGFQPAATRDFGNRQREDTGYKRREEIPETQTRNDERAHVDYDRPRDEPKIIMHHNDKAKGRFGVGDENEQNSRKGEMDGRLGSDRSAIETKPEISKTEDTRDTRQRRGDNKGDTGKGYEQPAWDQNDKKFQSSTTETYDNRQRRDNVTYTGYKEVAETERLKNDRRDRAYERGRSIDQPKIFVNQEDKSESHISRESRTEDRQNSRDQMKGRDVYDRTIVNVRQNQEGRQAPERSDQGGSYDYNRDQEERLRAREYDRRREEELKRREYERRLEEEMRKKDEDKGNINVKGTGYDRNREEVRRVYVRREDMINGSEHSTGGDQRIKGMVEQRERNIKGIKPNRNQEELSESEYVSRGVSYSRRDEMKGRNFETKSEEGLKGIDYDWRKEKGIEEIGFMGKGEERRQPAYDLRYENGRRHENMKGTDYIRKENGDTIRKENVRGNREITGTKLSERRQEDRTEKSQVSGSAKGETYNRETDHVIKRLNHDSRSLVSREQSGDVQKTTRTTIDSDDLHLMSTTVKGYNIRLENKNRTTNHSFVRGVTDDNYRITTYNGNSRVQGGINFKSTNAPRYGEASDSNTRRVINTERLPNYEERKLPRSDSDRNIRRNSSFDQERTNSNFPNPTSRTQINDNWKSARGPPNAYGYHPNVSYDTIIFLDDDSDEETDVWNLSVQGSKEPSHTIVDAEQSDYKAGRRDQRESQRRNNQRPRNEESIPLTPGATETRRRNNRATARYSVSTSELRRDLLPQRDEPSEIHPDVEILPGYGTTRQTGRRNYNDDVIDDEVELFSAREIKVNTKRYRTNETGDRNITTHNETESNKTSLLAVRHEEYEASGLTTNETFNRKIETTALFPSSSEAPETSTVDRFPAKPVPSESGISERRRSGSSRSYWNRRNRRT